MRKILSSLKAKLFGGKPAEERRKRVKLAITPDINQLVPGRFLFHHHLKLEITETKTNELTKWLIKNGWHVAIRNDRRRYFRLPEETFARLDLAPTSERPMLIRSLLRQYSQ